MLKPLLFAPFAFLGLASASPPPMQPGGGPAASDYPPCSAAVTDRCIQTNERGRRHRMREAYGPPPPPAPLEMSGGDSPPCSATRTDRCQQGGRPAAAPTRYASWERQRVRVGERG
jgi:hypothetical protein